MTPTWLVRRPKRPARGVLMVGCRLLVSAGLLGGCSSPSSPPQTAVYSAVSVNGHPLPAIYFAAGDSDGVLRTTLEAVAARLELRPDGTFKSNREVNRKLDGVVVESLRPSITGTFERTDTTIVLRYRNPGGGYDETVIYHLFEDGRVLRGIEDFAKMWEWVREEPSP